MRSRPTRPTVWGDRASLALRGGLAAAVFRFLQFLRRVTAHAALSCLLVAGAAARAPETLPPHLQSALPPGEIVARCEPCGPDCYLVFACAAGDTTMGRVLRLMGREGTAPRRLAEGAWVRSDLAGATAIVRAAGELTPDHVRVALAAVRPRLRPREIVREVHLQEPAAAGAHPVLAVTLARDGGGAEAARVLLVHLAPEGAFVESRGIATH
ncbi:MAG: hypothetical protein IPK64_11050 [bacterium]|nr:hypothetical protein [bacterium]